MNINPLPVEMSSFTYAVSRNNVVLNWQTLTESNNKSFTIERNSEGSAEWLQAGIVPGSGNSIELSEYSFKDMNLQKGIYKYRLKQTDFNGNFTYHSLQDDIAIENPAVFNLSQNYPNPFNPVTKIDYEVPNEGIVSLLIYDISGREVKKLITGFKPAGYYTESFDASGLSSGVYFYRLKLNANIGGRNSSQ
ncbi:MAG: T9SS type A sorting domain-containing protein [Ignavibacteria bacterium]|nr:T9SS type A sorting domain-containing protein [Ignavibacteria bacterium]